MSGALIPIYIQVVLHYTAKKAFMLRKNHEIPVKVKRMAFRCLEGLVRALSGDAESHGYSGQVNCADEFLEGDSAFGVRGGMHSSSGFSVQKKPY